MTESRSDARDERFRPLLPRPAWSTTQSGSASQQVQPPPTRSKLTRNSYTGCYARGCSVANCTSYIHQQLPWLIMSKTISVDDLSEHIQSLLAPDRNLAAPAAVPDAMREDLEFKELFHQYLSYDMPRIVALLAPPSSTLPPGQLIMARTKAIAELGSSAQVYFLLFASMAHILELVRREQLEAERISAKLYCRLTKFLREKLEVYKSSEAPHLILAILAMSSLDMSLGNQDAVCYHRTALAQLVSQVGLSYLGHSTTLVLSYDRLMSAFTSKPPLYAKMPDRSLLRQRAPVLKYGSALEQLNRTLDFDHDVQTVCLDLCNAIEIVETQNWTFRPERHYDPYTAADVQYLYFLREVIQNTCINLHARDLRNPQINRAILFAVMIIQYIILGKNELTWYSTTAANRLYNTLSIPDLNQVWLGHEELLCWLMCVMVLVPKPWARRAEALNLFTIWLRTVYHLHPGEIDRIMINYHCDLRAYIWCEPELDDMLDVALSSIRSTETYFGDD